MNRKRDIEKAKNGYIELCRFLFCAMILIHHTAIDPETGTILPGGFIAVEFFFFLSGAMAMKHLAKEKRDIPQKMQYAVSYTLHKIKRIFPYAACGTLIAYIWRIATVRDYTAQTWQELAVLPFELFFLPMTGLVPTRLDRYMNAPLWYVSAMFITLPLIVYLCLRAEDVFKHYIVWFVPFLIHGWMILHMGASWGWGEVTPVGFSGLLVAFSNMTMGFGVYLVAERLAGKKFGAIARILLTVCEVGAVALCGDIQFRGSDPFSRGVAGDHIERRELYGENTWHSVGVARKTDFADLLCPLVGRTDRAGISGRVRLPASDPVYVYRRADPVPAHDISGGEPAEDISKMED